MKLGYFALLTNPDLKKDMAQVLDETREVAIACDEAGWDTIWFAEHHFGHEGYDVMPNALMLSADIAARTKRIRVGQAANIITFWHPLRLAEDIALLDQLTKGRLEVAFGRGIYHREAVHLNHAADIRNDEQNRELFEETFEILLKVWNNEFFSHKGRFYQFPEPGVVWDHAMSRKSPEFMNMETKELTKLCILPRPYQKPHPPLAQVVDTPRSIEGAGKKKLKAFMWQPTVKSLKERFEWYRTARSEAEGYQVPLGYGLGLLRDMYVADSMEQAKAEAGPAVVNQFHYTCHWRGIGNMLDPGEPLPPGGKRDPFDPSSKLDALTYEWLHPRNLLFGTPDYVFEKIMELKREVGLKEILLCTTHPGLEHDKAMRSLRLFNTEVLPRLRAVEAKEGRAAAAE